MRWILILLAAYLTPSAPTLLAQSTFRVDVAAAPSSDASIAASQWTVRLQQRNVLLQWRCIPFTYDADTKLKSDSSLSAQVVSIQGGAIVSPTSAFAKTSLLENKQQDAIQMAMRGTGKIDVLLNVGIDRENATAGKHSTTIELTVTGG